jgi:plastocyanin
MHLRPSAFAITLLAAAALAASWSAHSAPVSRADNSAVTVSMVNNLFVPNVVTVPAGTTVTWVSNEDPTGTDVTHDVIADDYAWSSPYIDPGQSYSRTFDTPGTYNYLCDLHSNMVGTVIVQ